MRLAFLGTPEMAVPPLRALVDAGHEVVLVVTRADRRRGRGERAVAEPGEGRRARARPARSPTTSSSCSASSADLGVVVAYGRIIKPHVLAAPADGQRALLAAAALARRGARRAGAARRRRRHGRVHHGRRGGPRHRRCPRPPRGADRADDDGRRAAPRPRRRSAPSCSSTSWPARSARRSRRSATSPTPTKITPDELQLDWTRPAVELDRVVRVGGAWTTFRGRRLKVLAATPTDGAAATPGALDADAATVGTAAGGLRLDTVQPEGKAPMAWTAFANGARPGAGRTTRPVGGLDSPAVTERAHVDIRLLGPVAAFRDGEPRRARRAAPAGRPRPPGARRRAGRDRRPADRRRVGRRPAADGHEHRCRATSRCCAAPSARPTSCAATVPATCSTSPRGVLDVHRFEDGVGAAAPLVASDPAAALDLLDAALGEWRGPVPRRRRRRGVGALGRRALGRAAPRRRPSSASTPCSPSAGPPRRRAASSALTDEHPLREGFVRRLMLALYRAGRQADALRAFARTRAVLADELGLDPTPELQALQLAILDHDPSLAGPVPAAGRRRRVAAAAAGVAATGDRRRPRPRRPRRRPGLPLPGAAAPRRRRRRSSGATDLLGQPARRSWEAALRRHAAPRRRRRRGRAPARRRSPATSPPRSRPSGATVLWGRAAQEAIVPFEAARAGAAHGAARACRHAARERVIAERGAIDRAAAGAAPARADDARRAPVARRRALPAVRDRRRPAGGRVGDRPDPARRRRRAVGRRPDDQAARARPAPRAAEPGDGPRHPAGPVGGRRTPSSTAC